jgi:hypothetical protein
MPEPSGGFIAAAGVVRPPQPTHAEISSKGGRARTAAKIAASRRNLEKAKSIRDALGARPWHRKKKSN